MDVASALDSPLESMTKEPSLNGERDYKLMKSRTQNIVVILNAYICVQCGEEGGRDRGAEILAVRCVRTIEMPPIATYS